MHHKVIFSAIILSFTLLVSGCNDKAEPTNEENEQIVTPVEAATIETGNFNVEKSVYGRTAPWKQTPVLIEQPGEITTLKVENGDKVEQDDHLATIKGPMGNKTIYASTDGEVADLNVQEGAFQSNEEPLMMLIDLDKVMANFAVSSSIRDLFKQDEKVTLYIQEEKYEGKVLAIDTMPDETGQYPINVEMDNEDEKILPGMAVELSIQEQKVKDTIIIPTEAVLTESDEHFIFVVEKNKAKKVLVEVQETQSDKTAVDGDLKKGDQVIVNGQHTLSDGSTIEVKEGNEE